MGGAIMRAVCKKYDVSQIKVTDKNVAMGKAFAKETGATFVKANKDVLDCDYIFLFRYRFFNPRIRNSFGYWMDDLYCGRNYFNYANLCNCFQLYD
jgi:hypothetical protein